MRRAFDYSVETTILKKITDEFTKFREVSGGPCPSRLRELAVSAVSMGVTRIRVSQAAGVTPKTISNWSKSLRPQAKELSIVSESAAQPLSLSTADSASTGSIVIRLKSGVEIEITKRELTFEFLSLLNGLSNDLGDLGSLR